MQIGVKRSLAPRNDPSQTSILKRLVWSGSYTEEILGKPVTMPSGDLDPSVDNRISLTTENAHTSYARRNRRRKCPGELQGASSHFPKIRLFTQPLVRAYVSFDKASEQAHSVLYALGDCDRRQVARFFDRHLRFTHIAPKILQIQICNLQPVDDIQIRLLPIKVLNEIR